MTLYKVVGQVGIILAPIHILLFSSTSYKYLYVIKVWFYNNN